MVGGRKEREEGDEESIDRGNGTRDKGKRRGDQGPGSEEAAGRRDADGGARRECWLEGVGKNVRRREEGGREDPPGALGGV